MRVTVHQVMPKGVLSSLNVPARWGWHHRVLVALQSRLLRERGDLQAVAAEPLEPHSLDEADSATDEFDHDLALAQLSAEQDALGEVNAALMRIANGTYGICEATGQPIPAARLRAIPWTRLTRAAEARLEAKGVVHRIWLNKPATVRAKGKLWLAPEEALEETEEAPSAPPSDEALALMEPTMARLGLSRPPRPTTKRKGVHK
jgi:RNA polymerase-binding transcription factor DksA